jgi:hypothetical protein
LFYLVVCHNNIISTLLALFFVLYMSSNFLTVWSEALLLPNLMIAFIIISAIALILYISPKVKEAKKDRAFKVLLIVITGVNLAFLISLAEIIRDKPHNDLLFLQIMLGAFLTGVMGLRSSLTTIKNLVLHYILQRFGLS